MRDNTLAAAMQSLGHDVTLLPMYTPMRLDEENVGEKRIFYGGIAAFILQRFPQSTWWRDLLLKLAGAQFLLHLMPRFDIGGAVDPTANAELTLSMLRGEAGNQASLLDEMTRWLADDLKPDLIHITNTLISGVAPTLKRRLNVPIVCGLHGEDIFIEGLPPAYQQQALQTIQHNAASIDAFISISQYYSDYFSPQARLDPQRVHLVRPGIQLEDYQKRPARQGKQDALNIGYLARISPEKGRWTASRSWISWPAWTSSRRPRFTATRRACRCWKRWLPVFRWCSPSMALFPKSFTPREGDCCTSQPTRLTWPPSWQFY